MMNMKNGALTGIRVLDLSRLLPGPYCSMILADHGADVVAVEEKRFQATGHCIALLNRNKRHLALDLKTPAGRAVFLKLADRADVLIEGFRPGVARRWPSAPAPVRSCGSWATMIPKSRRFTLRASLELRTL
jgi:crotonobetainyl-CoA:carnitine CoA-transferase CaiB-like acyl-CoA transferase